MRGSPCARRPSRAVIAILAATFAVVGAVPAFRPVVASAAGVKVVVIVGPVEGLTSNYRSWAEKVALTAEKYGADVRRVYSPNATWQNVLDNIQGASVVVYMGHGNGYPNPYTSTFNPNAVDGFGLNTAADPSDYSHVYRGESYIANYVKLAPNAVVFLSHACYSAGSSESWDKDPTLNVAEQRVDNFAAGFIAAGARAVFALAHADPSPYVAKLFTTDASMKTIFETASDWNGTWVQYFPSVRSPGFDAEVDPQLDTRLDPPEPSYYLRSLVTWPGLSASQVTGFDPEAPQLLSFSPQAAYLSPDGDGVKDTVTFTGSWSAATNWRVQFQEQDGTALSTMTGSGAAVAATWSGEDGTATSEDGSPVIVPDGTYRVVVDGQDEAGHVSTPTGFTVTVDTVAPVLTAPSSRLYYTSTLGSTSAQVKASWSSSDAGGGISYRLQRQVNGGSWSTVSLSPATATSLKQYLAFGSTYRYRLRATDGAGNTSAYASGPSFVPRRAQETAASVAYGGTWYTRYATSYSGGRLKYATAAGAWASYTFTGASVGWVASRGPTRGAAEVYVDGVYKKTISLYAATYQSKKIVYAFNWSSNGSHTIKIVVLGTAGHPRVDVDAFVRLYRV